MSARAARALVRRGTPKRSFKPVPDALSRIYEEEDLEVSASTWASVAKDRYSLTALATGSS